MSEDTFDVGLEPAEQAALDALLREPQLTSSEWALLHAKLMHAAAPVLAVRDAPLSARSPRARRSWRWLVPALPLAAAAALLLVLRTGEDGDRALLAPEAALLADVSEQEFRLLVSGHADAASLLLLAVQDETED